MALIVEDGSALTNAESYCSVAFATEYNAAFGNTDWTEYVTEDREIALRRATQWLDNNFGTVWKGQKVSSTQALDWPRSGVSDQDGYGLPSDEIPLALKQACAEMAVRALADELDPDVENPGNIKRETIRVGPILESTEYYSRSFVTAYRRTTFLLQDYITGARGGGGKLLERA